MSRENHWHRRTFAAGTKRLAAVADLEDRLVEHARLVASAEAITACAALARIYEERDANAGIVRLILAQRADDAWKRVEAHQHSPLTEADSPPSRSASASGDRVTPEQGRAEYCTLVQGDAPFGLTASEAAAPSPSPLKSVPPIHLVTGGGGTA